MASFSFYQSTNLQGSPKKKIGIDDCATKMADQEQTDIYVVFTIIFCALKLQEVLIILVSEQPRSQGSL